MLKKFRNSLVAIVTGFSLLIVPVMAPATAYAIDIAQCLKSGANLSTSCSNPGTAPTTDLQTKITDLVNLFSLIVAIVAVIMIIYGGFRYITSGGESGNVSGAKNTIIYAVVGLIVVAVAQLIVRFVVDSVTSTV